MSRPPSTTMATPALIEFRSVDLGYRKKKVLSGLSFTIHQGEFVGIVGPNGSGKTTIVRAILGTLRPQRGEVIVRPFGDAPLRVGYVPQRDVIDQIMPFSVNDVVLMGRYRRMGLVGMPSRYDRLKVHEALQHVGIADLGRSTFKDLSGGQKQRVLIARALAGDPDVLILDEPTNGMDLSSRAAILELIKSLHSVDRLTVIMVSHLLSDVATYVQKIFLVEQNVFQVGPVDEILTEPNLSQVYNLPVSVGEFKGSKVILARGRRV